MPRRRETLTVQGKPHLVTRDYHTGVAYIMGHCCGCRELRDLPLRQVSPDRWRCDACAAKE